MVRKKKNKVKKTQKKMKEARKKDYIALREIMQKKLEWAKDEKNKGRNLIEHEKEKIENSKRIIENTQEVVYKLTGIITAFNDILNKCPKEKKKENK